MVYRDNGAVFPRSGLPERALFHASLGRKNAHHVLFRQRFQLGRDNSANAFALLILGTAGNRDLRDCSGRRCHQGYYRLYSGKARALDKQHC